MSFQIDFDSKTNDKDIVSIPMCFRSQLDDFIESKESGTAERIILEYLRENALGRGNAKPWHAIASHLELFDIQISQQTFQQGVLKESRESGVFIGSYDHAPSRGYFIVVDRQDAELMSDWYIRRISTLQSRLQHLRDLMNREFPI